jgi:hypothetical protein
MSASSCSAPTLRPAGAFRKPRCSTSSSITRATGGATPVARKGWVLRVARSKRTRNTRVSGLPPFQSDQTQEQELDGDDMTALLSVTRKYPTQSDQAAAVWAQSPEYAALLAAESLAAAALSAAALSAAADAATGAAVGTGVVGTGVATGERTATSGGPDGSGRTSSGSGSTTITAARSANAVDLFARAAAPMGAFERAEAALAAARAISSPGIIKVNPGSTVRRERPTFVGDASVREANDSIGKNILNLQSPVNFAKPFAQRNAEGNVLSKANDPAARVKAVAKANSEEQMARERIVAAERLRNQKKYQNASSFYGGGGQKDEKVRAMFGSEGGSSGDSSASGDDGSSSTKASDFWKWAPPDAPGQAPGSPYYAPPEPMRQKAPEYTRRVEAAVTTMERAPEQTLDLAYQSATETETSAGAVEAEAAPAIPVVASTTPVVSSLTFQREVARSVEVEARSVVDLAPPKQAAKVERAPAVEASLEDALSSAVRELGAEGGAMDGTLSSGARWWREEGKELLEDGKVMSWTVIRGTSADGAVEWEEKFWETSDAFTYRELGAVKSGRDSKGQAWQESWKEIYQHDVNGTPFIHREASKWSHTPAGQCWSEGWTEDYRSDGSVDRYCEKTGSLEDHASPDDGHANRWTEKWGEKWDGGGSCIKWTDTWASRDHAEGGLQVRIGPFPNPADCVPIRLLTLSFIYRRTRPAGAGVRSGKKSGVWRTTRTAELGRGKASRGTRWVAGTLTRPGERNTTRTDGCTSTGTRLMGASTGTSGKTGTAGGGKSCRRSGGTKP